ncbi:hypothetical protein ACUOFC_53510, partial [Escherichia sp. TWPC-MK]
FTQSPTFKSPRLVMRNVSFIRSKLVSIDEKPNFRTHVVELPDHMLDGLETGAFRARDIQLWQVVFSRGVENGLRVAR